jgi:hypothetical protein
MILKSLLCLKKLVPRPCSVFFWHHGIQGQSRPVSLSPRLFFGITTVSDFKGVQKRAD